MANQSKKAWNLKISKFELFWYTLCGAVAIWGLVYIVLGLIAHNLPITNPTEGLVEANENFAATFGLDFFFWGIIIFAIAALAIVICLLLAAGKVDRDYEKNVRRAARMAQLEAEEEKAEAALANGQVVDAVTEPVNEDK